MRFGERLEVQLNKALMESVTKLAQHGLVSFLGKITGYTESSNRFKL